MLSYLGLFILQIILAFYGKDLVLARLGETGTGVDVFIEGVIVAVIVWGTALLASLVSTSLRRPGAGALVACVIGAMAGTVLAIGLSGMLLRLPIDFNGHFLPIGGAMVGYILRRRRAAGRPHRP